MPIYEYECRACGRRFEVLQKVDSDPIEVCSCGVKGKLRKLLSAPMIQFKGSGWYVTDYSGKNNGDKREEAEKKEISQEAKKGNSDSKRTAGVADESD